MTGYEYLARDYLSEKQIVLYDGIVELLKQHQESEVYTELNDDQIGEVIKSIIGDYPQYTFAWQNECDVIKRGRQVGRFVRIRYCYDKSKANVMRYSIDSYIRENIMPYVRQSGCKTERDIVAAIYEYLSRVFTYTEKKIKKNGILVYPQGSYTLETLFNLEGVCQGIALSLIYILRMYEIDCLYIRGRTADDALEDNGGAPTHGWCMVKLDGVYYHLDLTWDLHEKNFQYFLLTDAEIYERRHRWVEKEYPKAG